MFGSKFSVNLLALGLLFSLVACGQSSAPVTPPPIPIPAPGLKVTVVDYNQLPVSGVWVQLDNDAAGALKTDANGNAIFTQATVGAHDVHMFAGGSWVSYFQVNGRQVNFGAFTQLNNNAFSFLRFKGALTNLSVGEQSELRLFRAGNNAVYASSMVPSVQGSYLSGMSFWGDAPGAQISGDLWAIKSYVSRTVQAYDAYTTDAVNLGPRRYATVDIYSTLTNVENVAFNATPPGAQPLVTISRVAPPAGFKVGSNRLISGNGMALAVSRLPLLNPYASITYPKVLSAFDRYSSASYNVEVSASDANGNTWVANTQSLPLSSVAISSTLTTPTVMGGQVGSPIIVTPATGMATVTALVVQDVYAGSTWVMLAPPDVSSVALPTAFPTGVAPSFTTGATFLTFSLTRTESYTYDQILTLQSASIGPNIGFESIQAAAVPYQF